MAKGIFLSKRKLGPSISHGQKILYRTSARNTHILVFYVQPEPAVVTIVGIFNLRNKILYFFIFYLQNIGRFILIRIAKSETRFHVLFEGHKRDNQKKGTKEIFADLNQKFSVFFREGSFAPVFGMMSLALMTISVMMRLFYKPAKVIRIITKTRTKH